MTKYSPEFKLKIVRAYFEGEISSAEIAKEIQYFVF